MGTALDRVLSVASGYGTAQPVDIQPDMADEGTTLAMTARDELAGAYLILASDPDDDGDDDSSSKGDTDGDAGHTSHATFKKLKAKGMPDKLAAKMCSKADAKKVAASMLGRALVALNALDLPEPLLALSVTQAERDKAHSAGNSLPDKSYPINNAKQLHSAAVLAASGHGDVSAAKRLIRRRAKELNVDVNTLPGFGSSDDDEKVAASMIALANKGGPPALLHMHESMALHHGPFTGQHNHPHVVRTVVHGPHYHNGDNTHGHMVNPGDA